MPVFTGTTSADTINGSEGDDTISGGIGNDVLSGAGGSDLITGDNGNDSLVGGAGEDTLDGGLGNDTLVGDAGDDRLIGGIGTNTPYGGTGHDTFVIGVYGNGLSSNAANDTVADFSLAEDRIDFTALGIESVAAVEFIRSASGSGTASKYTMADSPHTMTVQNVAPTALTAANYILAAPTTEWIGAGQPSCAEGRDISTV
ncbi:MAG TPA: M10 family metallopeptidase C-terminal domain-containing protein [Alphaproteobacteria bacterium]|nr:M10 family metallopeptidase C-terminal domain-containing protein [Alphaproteobacteria bacterium]